MKRANKKVRKTGRTAAKKAVATMKKNSNSVRAHSHEGVMHKIACACGDVMGVLGNMLMKGSKKLRGFTLIELLIVVAIIGILAVSLLPNIVGAPARARDAGRKAEVVNIVTAVEQYYVANGTYPPAAFCITKDDNTYLYKFFKGQKSPDNPTPAGAALTGTAPDCTSYYYCPLASPNNYMIGVRMETNAATKGYRAAGADFSNCDTVAGGVDTDGNVYVSVQ